eukprot:jgi/Chrzof1/10628/Cz05g05220.t1
MEVNTKRLPPSRNKMLTGYIGGKCSCDCYQKREEVMAVGQITNALTTLQQVRMRWRASVRKSIRTSRVQPWEHMVRENEESPFHALIPKAEDRRKVLRAVADLLGMSPACAFKTICQCEMK